MMSWKAEGRMGSSRSMNVKMESALRKLGGGCRCCIGGRRNIFLSYQVVDGGCADRVDQVDGELE